MNIVKFKEPIENLEAMDELGEDRLISGNPSGDLKRGRSHPPIRRFSAVKGKSRNKSHKRS